MKIKNLKELPQQLRDGDIVFYSNFDMGKFLIDKGTVKGDDCYRDGVEVHGDGWKQYVSKYFIVKVVRNKAVIFIDENYSDLFKEKITNA